MSTSTKTKVAEFTKTDATLTKEVTVMFDLTTKTENQTATVIRTLQSAAKRLGLDRDDAGKLLFNSIRAAKTGKPANQGGIAAKPTDEALQAFKNAQRFNVSRIMGFAFPPDDVKAEMEKGLAHDESKNGAKHGRVGIRGLALIKQGLTVEQVLAGVKPAKKNANQDVPKVLDLSAEAFENDLAGLRAKYCKATATHPAAFTPKAARTLAAKVFCDGAYTPAKTETPAETPAAE